MADPVNYIPLGQGSETDALEALEEKGAPVVQQAKVKEQEDPEDEDDDKPKQSKQPHPKK